MPSDSRRESSNINNVLSQLRNDLKGYFSYISNQCNEETNKFQKFVFSSLLDVLSNNNELLESINTDQGTEKKKLKDVFNLFSMLDKPLIDKIDSFYNGCASARDFLIREQKIDVKTFSYLINASRIHTIINEWTSVVKRQNEIEKRKTIFFDLLSILFQHKKLLVNEANEIVVSTEEGKQFPIEFLSSGEKQLLIILGNALLFNENEPHIYIADEPELSLHIEWQERLVSSIRRLSPNAQIIFATHSPDIVGEYQKNTIILNKIIYGR